MAWSVEEIRAKKYLPFPGHNDEVSKSYHSEMLPNPNVIRIEVLSPSARGAYLNNGLYAMTNRFQQTLMESLMYDDATKPFYGFFDPADNNGLSFGVQANWGKGKHGFGAIAKEIADGVKGKISVAGKVVGKAGTFIKHATDMAGLNTDSTGACTMRDFTGADFSFGTTVKCKWYMPEQEYMARLSIARLLTLTFVRSANMDNADLAGKLVNAVTEVITSKDFTDLEQSITDMIPEEVLKFVGDVGNALGTKVNRVTDFLGLEAPGPDTKKNISDAIKRCANGGLQAMLKVNSFFGGNITINPFPVRVTIGHILDIEPAVIEHVTFHVSEEQFISDDGTHIPLYITADIRIGMWMTPDPKKGFIRWMGDDVFNSGRYLSGTKTDEK